MLNKLMLSIVCCFKSLPERIPIHFFIHRDAIEQHNVFTLKTESGVVGILYLMNHGEGTAEIYKLYILEQFRGFGYGADTVKTLLAIFKREGFNEVVVEVLTLYVVPFWEKFGFIPLDAGWDGNRHFSLSL